MCLPVVLVVQWIQKARFLPEHPTDLLDHGTQENQKHLENPKNTHNVSQYCTNYTLSPSQEQFIQTKKPTNK